jgi:hypothetical protein
MKQGLTATAYVAPAVLTMAPAPVGAQVSGPGCHTTFTMTPASSSSVQYAPVLHGTGFTPNGVVQVNQVSGWVGQCRGIVIVPGTSFQADAFGNFTLTLPKTALNFSVVTTQGVFPIQVIDATSGCSSTFDYTITPITVSPADSLTLLYVPSPVSSPLAPPAPPVPGESGLGTVLLGQCHVTTGLTELRFTLNGATPNRTFTLFITPSAGSALAVGRTVTTDASGSASFAAYVLINNGVFAPGDPNHVCFGNLSSATLSLTIDGNPPGASNVAYRSTLVRNDIPTC